jgi:hypothetical protein
MRSVDPTRQGSKLFKRSLAGGGERGHTKRLCNLRVGQASTGRRSVRNMLWRVEVQPSVGGSMVAARILEALAHRVRFLAGGACPMIAVGPERRRTGSAASSRWARGVSEHACRPHHHRPLVIA